MSHERVTGSVNRLNFLLESSGVLKKQSDNAQQVQHTLDHSGSFLGFHSVTMPPPKNRRQASGSSGKGKSDERGAGRGKGGGS
eukprot:816764-Karenia_brevis.AAC.1